MAPYNLISTHLDYDLPAELIAQAPPSIRGDSRMMVLDPVTREITHDGIAHLDRRLGQSDVLVVNDSRVFPARIRARKESGGEVEILLLHRTQGDRIWKVMCRPLKRLHPGTRLRLAGGGVATVIRREDSHAWIGFRMSDSDLSTYLDRHGEMPVPPYIKRERGDERFRIDRERYQTVYAEQPGSVAAPTAGLHFTNPLLDRIRGRGVQVVRVALHVGPATFLPLEEDWPSRTTLPGERYEIPVAAAEALNLAWGEGRRIVAVGTTVSRTLEDSFLKFGRIEPGAHTAELFIKPGFHFRVVGALLTNFHQPRTSVFALAGAFAGVGFLKRAYAEAIREKYRFLSYGDATLMTRRGQAGD